MRFCQPPFVRKRRVPHQLDDRSKVRQLMLNKKYFFQQGFILNHDNVSLTFQSYFGNFLMTILMEKSNSYSTEINKKDIEPSIFGFRRWDRNLRTWVPICIYSKNFHECHIHIIVYKNWEISWLLWNLQEKSLCSIPIRSFCPLKKSWNLKILLNVKRHQNIFRSA